MEPLKPWRNLLNVAGGILLTAALSSCALFADNEADKAAKQERRQKRLAELKQQRSNPTSLSNLEKIELLELQKLEQQKPSESDVTSFNDSTPMGKQKFDRLFGSLSPEDQARLKQQFINDQKQKKANKDSVIR